MACHALRQSVAKAATAFLVGLSIWVLVLLVLSMAPLDWGSRTGVYTPTGLLTATTQPGEPGIVFERQMRPR